MALHMDQLLAADLSGAVVFAANCYLPQGPTLSALLGAGTRAVVAGWGTKTGPTPNPSLGLISWACGFAAVSLMV
jgi:hypothetical protein